MGLGYVACRLFWQSQTQRWGTSGSGAGGKPGTGGGKEYPMIDMADVARRAVPRKKSFLYTRNGDKGTSQVSSDVGWGQVDRVQQQHEMVTVLL